MFRRSPGRPLRGQLAGEVPPALRRANELMATGQNAEAAEIFEQFAKAAEARGGPRAPWLFLQAGRARVRAKQGPAAMALFRQSLTLFQTRGQPVQLANAGMQVMEILNRHGLKAEMVEIGAFLKTANPGGVPTASAPAPQKRPLLPTTCPGCGGPIRSDEVEWVDDMTAECPYCGSAVRAE